jgi:ribonuclease HI
VTKLEKSPAQPGAAPARSVEVYIDGSYRPRKARYGFLVIEEGQRIFAEAGDVRPARDGFPGRVRSNDCEVFAALRALDWLAANLPEAAPTLITDSQTVAEIQAVRPADPYLAHLQARLRLQPLAIRKVKAHRGCIYNAGADRLARSGRHSTPRSPSARSPRHREPEVAALEFVGEAAVIHAEKVEHGGVEIVDFHGVFDGSVA